jgi:hypothetical protein
MKKDFKQFFEELESQGYKIERKKKHIKITGPQGDIFFAAATPSDYRALENLKKDIRRGRPKVDYKNAKKGNKGEAA